MSFFCKQYTVDGEMLNYRSSMVYDSSGIPEYVLHPEGMAVHTGNGQWEWRYHLSDYLGNTRAVLDENGTVSQQTDYHPFGAAYSLDSTDKNKYLYGGKELQDEVLGGTPLNMYDFEARFYDPMGRFTSPDPLREVYYNVSPYVYANNNPILFVDRTGMDWYSYQEEYKDENGDTQTRTAYKYREGTMSQEEMEAGGYTHLGKTYTAEDTYYSLGGAEVKYDKSNPFSMVGVTHLMNADRSIIASVNALDAAGDFWDKYGQAISTGSDVATLVEKFMDVSKGFKGVSTGVGYVAFVSNLISDAKSLMDGNLKGEKLADAIMNVVSLAGAPGAALSLGYTAAKKGAEGLQWVERGLRQEVNRQFHRYARWW